MCDKRIVFRVRIFIVESEKLCVTIRPSKAHSRFILLDLIELLLCISEEISDKNIQNLISAAIAAKEHAYCPYSNFRVGSAVLCEDGSVFSGM